MIEETVAKFEVTHEGNFDFDNLYKSLYLWFKENEYKDVNEHDDFYEILYQEVILGEAKNMNIWWRLRKTEDKYIRQVYNVNFRLIFLRKIKVQQGQKEVKTYNGEININVEAKFLFDYDNLWEKNDFLKFMAKTFMRNNLEAKREVPLDRFTEEAFELQTFMKEHLGLSKPPIEPFHPLSR